MKSINKMVQEIIDNPNEMDNLAMEVFDKRNVASNIIHTLNDKYHQQLALKFALSVIKWHEEREIS